MNPRGGGTFVCAHFPPFSSFPCTNLKVVHILQKVWILKRFFFYITTCQRFTQEIYTSPCVGWGFILPTVFQFFVKIISCCHFLGLWYHQCSSVLKHLHCLQFVFMLLFCRSPSHGGVTGFVISSASLPHWFKQWVHWMENSLATVRRTIKTHGKIIGIDILEGFDSFKSVSLYPKIVKRSRREDLNTGH